MQSIVEWGLANAATAALLALGVAVITRVWRNPHLAHLLWLIVLLRLVAPPVIQVPLPTLEWRGARDARSTAVTSVDVPGVSIAESSTARRAERSESTAFAPTLTPSTSRSESSLPLAARTQTTGPREGIAIATERPASDALALSPATLIPVWEMLAGVWISGSVLYAALTVARVRRFGLAIRRSSPIGPGRLEGEIGDVAHAIGLRRLPNVRVVDWTLPPMIWSGVRPTLLVPRALDESIDPAQRRLLLLHELLHIRRGDHLVRWFAVAVLALYWWNPFAWWAVRRLQNAEEECCDAAVLSFHPQQSEIYGEALLAVSEFVSCGSLPAPAVSIGVERKHHLKRRMTMILGAPGWPKLSKTRVAAIVSCGSVLCAVSFTGALAQSEIRLQPDAGTIVLSQEDGVKRPVAGTAVLPQENSTEAQRSIRPNSTAPHSDQPSPAPLSNQTSGAAARGRSECVPAMLSTKRMKLAPDDDDVRKLLKERYNQAVMGLNDAYGRAVIDPLPTSTANIGGAARRLLDAELALASPNDTLSAYERYLELTQFLEHRAEGLLKAKLISKSDLDAVQWCRRDAEAKLRQQRAGSGERVSDGSPATTQPTGVGDNDPSQALSALLQTSPSEQPVGDDDVHKQLKGRYESAFKSLQLQFEQECRKCHTNPTNEQWHRAADIRIGQRGGEHAPEKRSGGKVQSLKLRVRIAEGEVNAARAVVDQTEAELKRILTNLKYRQAELDRVQSVRKRVAGSISDSGLDEAIRARDDAAAGVEAGRATIRAALAQVEIKKAQLEQVHLELKQAASEGK